jgi:hypothetical protein
VRLLFPKPLTTYFRQAWSAQLIAHAEIVSARKFYWSNVL